MRSRPFIITAGVLLLLFALVGAVYAYDQSGRDKIPKGVTVAGIDVGGLDAADAKARLESQYLTRLEKPIKVHHGNRTFVLTPQQSEVKANLDAMVDDALAARHDGNMFTRTFRRITGGELHRDLTPETTYSKANVVRFLNKIRASVNRDPVDAKVDFVNGEMQVQEGRDGLAVKAHDLHSQIRAAVVSPEA